jgi:hypothetical protein
MPASGGAERGGPRGGAQRAAGARPPWDGPTGFAAHRSRMARYAPALGTLVVFGCQEPSPSLAGWVAGCADVEAGPACVLAPDPSERGPVTVWVSEARGPVHTTLDGEPLAAVLTSTRGGVEVVLTAPRPGAVVVASEAGRYAVRLGDAAVARSEDLALDARAREALRAGSWGEAVAALDRAADGHARAGAWSRAVRDMQAAAYALLFRGFAPDEAERRLERAEAWLTHDRDGWAIHPYYRGLAALRASEPLRAVEELREARARLAGRRAEQLVAGVDEALAVVLQQLGRGAEAQAVLQRLRERPASEPCVQARRLNNVAWAGLLAADAEGRAADPETRAALDAARAAFARPECREAPGRWQAGLHLALAELLSGRPAEAQAALRDLPPELPDLDARLWALELEARLDLAEGHPAEAQRRLEVGLERLPDGALPDARWRLLLGLAGARAAGGDPQAALAAYARADALLDHGALRVPFGEGRAAFSAARRRGAAAWAEALLARGDVSGAACVLRRARARGLTRAVHAARLASLGPDERAAWGRHMGAVLRLRAELEASATGAWALAASELGEAKRAQARLQDESEGHLRAALAVIEGAGAATPACAELRGPGPGELVLVFARLGGEVWGLALSPRSARAQRVGAGLDAAGWLASFDAELEAAERVRLVVELEPGLAQAHAWPWRGRPLNAQRPVVFGLDVPGGAAVRGAASEEALVVADPEGNLPGARAEAQVARAALAAQGWRVELLEGAAAGPGPVREALGRSALFHFSGHGRARGASPFGHRLGLYRGALEVQDVLSMGAAPRWVVLTGCQTSPAPALDAPEALGLAQAFLLAGSAQVLGATVEVSDGLARRVGAAVHGGGPEARGDLAVAFQAVAAALEADGVARWSEFQVWEP